MAKSKDNPEKETNKDTVQREAKRIKRIPPGAWMFVCCKCSVCVR
jgi:hypothetical protein